MFISKLLYTIYNKVCVVFLTTIDIAIDFSIVYSDQSMNVVLFQCQVSFILFFFKHCWRKDGPFTVPFPLATFP